MKKTSNAENKMVSGQKQYKNCCKYKTCVTGFLFYVIKHLGGGVAENEQTVKSTKYFFFLHLWKQQFIQP